MKKILFDIIIMIIAMLSAVLSPGIVSAAPDQYVGDTCIYGGAPVILEPNVLILIDTSISMNDTLAGAGGTYNPATTYAPTYNCTVAGIDGSPCDASTVYNSSYVYINLLGSITTSCNSQNPRNILQATGQYSVTSSAKKLNSTGGCSTSNGPASYYTGNYINWLYDMTPSALSKLDIARSAMSTLVQSTSGVKFGLMKFNGQDGGTLISSVPTGTIPAYVTSVKKMDTIHSGTLTNRQALADTIQSLSGDSWTPLAESLYEAMLYFKGGTHHFGNNVGTDGTGKYISPIEFGCQKNYVIFVTDGMSTADDDDVLGTLCTNGNCDGDTWKDVDPSTPSDTLPVEPNCAAGGCSSTRPVSAHRADSPCSSASCDKWMHALDDVAKYMHEHDLKTGATGTQNIVTTYTVGFGLGGADAMAISLLTRASDTNHGNGKYFPASSAQQLSLAFSQFIANISAVDSAFVAPVVPVNPENKLQFGNRVYMGFFKPDASGFWSGNMKKFALNDDFDVVDANGIFSNYVDSNGDGIDDRDNAVLSADLSGNAIDGSFRYNARSYWTPTTVKDSGLVESGGVGDMLLTRNYSITSVTGNIAGAARNIYTFIGPSKNLWDTDNGFKTSNTANITAAKLGLPGAIITGATTTDVKTLINYVHGFDVYSATTPTTKRDWIMGDVLHSKPLVVSYATFSYSDEGVCSTNKNMIYVGTNDGMLHAFNDCDGSEAWAFIPPDLLPNLQYLRDVHHAYFVDSSIQYYKYDKNPGDGSLASSKNDSVILVVGLRRGGGLTAEPNKGFYYALDVTDPALPKYLWTISNATTGFTDLGEAWSEPKIGKILVGSSEKLAAFIGGGYDNCNEDARFGATQYYSGSCVNAIATTDGGLDGSNNPITSTGVLSAATFTTSNSYKGRGVYVVELATFPSSTSTSGLDLSNSGSLIWKYTFNNGDPLQYSMLSEIAALDLTAEGYVDRLYMGDSGGNMWRFNLSATTPASWTVTKIFSSNPGSSGYPTSTVDTTDIGRKIFYRPAVSSDRGMVWLFFGTGDREHPLNRAVEDRIYGLIDKGQTSAVTEAKLVDVTTDPIQSSTTQADVDAAKAKHNLASDPTNTTLYGWYIRLDGGDRTPVVANPGEKVLATAAVAAGNVYVTTYSPTTSATTTTSTNPCQLGNLGTGALYVLNYWSGSAVMNYDPANDPSSPTYRFNQYAFTLSDWKSGKNNVLLRTDRHRQTGQGIPSSAVVLCNAGDAACKWLIGCGGGICSDSGPDNTGSLVSPVYWRQK